MVSCNTCGKTDDTLLWNGLFLQFCSFPCMKYYYRHGAAFLTILNLLLVLISPLFTVGIILFGIIAVQGYAYIPPEHPQLNEPIHKIPSPKEKREEDPEATMYIPELDQKFRPCCYQSARLSDKYCPCGRGVDRELIEVVASYREIENS